MSKIIPALQSRCTRFRFAPLAKAQIEGRLRYIIDKEGLSARTTDDGVTAILRLANGDMRRVLNILQATSSGFDTIDADAVYACTGSPRPEDIKEIMQTLLNEDVATAYAKLQEAGTTKGLALADILTELYRFLAATALPPDMKTLITERLADIEYVRTTVAADLLPCWLPPHLTHCATPST